MKLALKTEKVPTSIFFFNNVHIEAYEAQERNKMCTWANMEQGMPLEINSQAPLEH